ncbi:hypothetical protein OEZ85_009149 [Tetradesmus obliquus]|uniref:GCK domain-containing protein n=1 Tax=Tetradesmus obliquus TaxID=3088 RepID=A0ABY8TN63_TETOB|nr:hypothetical protein OEZ85_009149 [Tetradesmus obliquus]
MSGSGSSSTAAAKDAKEECAWCKFMKGGPCRAVFETWQSCVDSVADGPEGAADEETRKQAVEKCSAVTAPLFECLVQHPEYYGPQLDSMKQRDAQPGAKEQQQQQAPGKTTTGSSVGQQAPAVAGAAGKLSAAAV